MKYLFILILQITILHAQGSVEITGTGNHFRMMSSPVPGQILSDLLDELWTQGMTAGGDQTTGGTNVWTYSGSAWETVTDISNSGTSLSAGQGFIVFVFIDTDFDGDTGDSGANGYLPVTLSVSGTPPTTSRVYNTSNQATDSWHLLGNPYATTIDVDQDGDGDGGTMFVDNSTSFNQVVYIYDSSSGNYISWNGSAGGVTGGLIKPYQGFFVQAKNTTTQLYMFHLSKCNTGGTSGTFYRQRNTSNNGSISFIISTDTYIDKTYISFSENGEVLMDDSDAYKLLPLTANERIVGISYVEENGLDVNNLPYFQDQNISVPLDIMYLITDNDYNYVTKDKDDVTINWDLSSVPDHISFSLTDNITGNIIDLNLENEYFFSTYEKGSFSSYNTNGTGPGIYPQIGESRFLLTVHYNNISGDINEDGILNILDIIEIIALILINEYNEDADCNGDMELNVLDVVMIVDSILTN